VDEWSENYLHGIAKSTQDNDQTMARKHVKPALGDIALVDLDTADVNAWLRDMATETEDHQAYSKSTIKLARKVLVMALEHARSERRVTENVAKDAKVPNASVRTSRALTTAEIKRFLVAAKGNRYENSFIVQIGLGLRMGEALALSWEDVDGDRLHVRHSQKREDGKLVPRGDLKTESSHRTLTMPKAVSEALWEQRIERRVEDEEASTGLYSNPMELMFPDQLGGPTRPETYRRQLMNAFDLAGDHRR
jgi:integrase